jgi:hypothetical protein
MTSTPFTAMDFMRLWSAAIETTEQLQDSYDWCALFPVSEMMV